MPEDRYTRFKNLHSEEKSTSILLQLDGVFISRLLSVYTQEYVPVCCFLACFLCASQVIVIQPDIFIGLAKAKNGSAAFSSGIASLRKYELLLLYLRLINVFFVGDMILCVNKDELLVAGYETVNFPH